MDTKEIAATMEGIAGALKTIELAMELSSQTNRLHNVLNRLELQEVAGNAVVAMRKLHENLKTALTTK